MKEKVLYINLPEGAKYRKVKVTEDGRIGIVYTELSANSEDSSKLVGSIPKPIPLIGGTEVYQKENGTPYWYCRIKDGRDEFMNVYFDDLTEEDLFYDLNGHKREFVTEKQRKFKADVLKALKNKPKEGDRWIPVYEPSMNKMGSIYYLKGQEVIRGLSANEWENELEKYSVINGSRQASITTYFLLLLRWLKDGMATIEQVTDSSKEIGHYLDSKDAKHNLEKTGEREFGGLYGFVGNTYKIVKDSESNADFSIVGGCYDDYGFAWPLADVVHETYPITTYDHSVGLLELIQ